MARTAIRHIDDDDAGVRLDKYLNEKYPQHTRSYFTKLIKNGHVLVNDHNIKSGYIVCQDDRIQIEFSKEEVHLTPQNIEINIVYEDEAILVINKQAGLTVHPGKGQPDGTLVNALLNHTRQLGQGDDTDRPGIVHRLDKYTSGLIVVAKTTMVLRNLQAQFHNKKISRIYQALAWGKFNPKQGTIHTHINRSKREPTKMTVSKAGREAITHYKVLEDFEYVSLVQLELETGRTHQIRVHLNHIHHPIVGDPDYHGRESQLKRLPLQLQKRGQHLINLLDHQALHAKSLRLIHPINNETLQFDSELPLTFKTALKKIPQIFLLNE